MTQSSPIELRLLELLRQHKRSGLSPREMADQLQLHGSERKQLHKVLRQLTSDGSLRERKGIYRLSKGQGGGAGGDLFAGGKGVRFCPAGRSAAGGCFYSGA